jgi:membrane protease YdiL (CAAX protease family)
MLDHVVLAVILLEALSEWLWLWPRYLRAIARGVPGARARVYRNLLIAEWTITLYVIALWAARGRPWASLMLGPVAPVRLGLGLAFALTVVSLLLVQQRAIFSRPKRVKRLREKLAFGDPLLPHTVSERRRFRLVAMTAGICEEIVFRGFLMWYIGAWTGPALAVVLSSAIFGFGHIYLGLSQVPRTAVVGLIFALLALASGSLWPAIVIHAAVDWNSGDMGFRALGSTAESSGADALGDASAANG